MTQVCDVMTRGVRAMSPGDTMVAAARAMGELDVGALPVCEDGRLVGMVTDRDITLRGVARGLPADSTPLRELMSPDVLFCREDASLEQAMTQMRGGRVRRLPVVDGERRLVGILAMGDIANAADTADVADTLACISQAS
jgi:CBS domain-containing protein